MFFQTAKLDIKSNASAKDFPLLTHLEEREELVLAALNPGVDRGGVETFREVGTGRELTDAHAGSGLVEDNSVTDEAVSGTLEVVAGAATVGQVKSRLALIITRSKNLDEIRLATAGSPARAVAVLSSAGDLAVQGPDGGHVAVEAAVAVHGHFEAEEEDLVSAGETLVGDVLGTGESAGLVAGLAAPDGEFFVALDEAGLEDLGLGAATGAVSVQVGKGVAPGADIVLAENPKSSKGEDWNLRVELARALTTVVAEEDNVVCNTIFGVVVCYTVPVFAAVADLVLEVGKRALGRRGRRGLRLGWLGLNGRGSGRRGILDWSGSISGSSGATEPVVLPRDNLTVDGGNDHVGALGLALGVEVSVAVAAGVDVRRGLLDVTLLGGRRVIDGNLLELEGTTEVKRKLGNVSLIALPQFSGQ